MSAENPDIKETENVLEKLREIDREATLLQGVITYIISGKSVSVIVSAMICVLARVLVSSEVDTSMAIKLLQIECLKQEADSQKEENSENIPKPN